MQVDDVNMSFDKAKQLIQTNYVDKVIAFLRKEAKRGATNSEFMKVYEVVMNQCDAQDNGQGLYAYFQKIIADYVEEQALPYTLGKKGTQLLEAWVEQWNNYTIFCKLLNRMFDYLNRYYLKNQSMNSLGVTSLKHFVSHFYERVKQDLLKALLEELTKDRNGEIINQDCIKAAIKTYVDMGLQSSVPDRVQGVFMWTGDKNLQHYEKEFEEPFLQKVNTEYEQRANLWISQLNC